MVANSSDDFMVMEDLETDSESSGCPAEPMRDSMYSPDTPLEDSDTRVPTLQQSENMLTAGSNRRQMEKRNVTSQQTETVHEQMEKPASSKSKQLEKSPPSLQQSENMQTEGATSENKQMEQRNTTSHQTETVNKQMENVERKVLRGRRILGNPSMEFSVNNAADSEIRTNFLHDVSEEESSYKKEHKTTPQRHLTSSPVYSSTSANLKTSHDSRTEKHPHSTSTESERGEKRTFDQEANVLKMKEDSMPELAENISQLQIGNSHKRRSPIHTSFPSEGGDQPSDSADQGMERRDQPTESIGQHTVHRDQPSECRDKVNDNRDQCNEFKDQITERKDKSNSIIKCLEHLSGEELYDLLNKQDDDGDNLLILSIIESCTSLSFTIIRVTPSISLLNLRNKLGQSALHVSVLTRQPLVTRRLVLAGADVLVRDVHGNTPLHTACIHDDLDAAIALTKRISTAERMTNDMGADCVRIQPQPQPQPPSPQHAYNYRGDTPAHIAAQHDNTDLVRYLLETTGADVNCPHGRCGRTLLHVASELGHTNTLRYLLSLPGTDRHAVTYAGQGALDLAAGRRHGKIVRMLRKAGLTFQYEEKEDDYTEYEETEMAYTVEDGEKKCVKKDTKEREMYDLDDFKLNMKSKGKKCESLMYDDMCVSGRFLDSQKV